jgi:hypothetical protein
VLGSNLLGSNLLRSNWPTHPHQPRLQAGVQGEIEQAKK